MKSFDEVASPNVRIPRPKPCNTDDLRYKYKQEVKKKEMVLCRIVPFIIARYPELLDAAPVRHNPEDIALVYKKINSFLDLQL